MLLAARALGLGATLTTLYLQFEKEAEAALGLPPGAHSYALLPIGYPMGRFGTVRRVPLPDVVYEDRWGQPYGAAPSGRVVFLLISSFLIRDDADRALSARHHTAVRAFVELPGPATSHRRPAVTQRLVLSSNSWPCGHLTPRPAVTQRFALSLNSCPCGHFWAGPTPPNPTHLFSRGTNIWPGGQLPCAAAGVETKFSAINIAASIRPAPRRKPNAAVFLPMAQPPFDEPRTARSVARSRSKGVLEAIFFFCGVHDNKVLV